MWPQRWAVFTNDGNHYECNTKYMLLDLVYAMLLCGRYHHDEFFVVRIAN